MAVDELVSEDGRVRAYRDAIADLYQLWEEDVEGANPYLVDYQLVEIDGLQFYLRSASPAIVWDKVP